MNWAEDPIAAAHRAAIPWGGLSGPPRLIRNRENLVFEVHLAQGPHAALRLHREGYQSADAIRGELTWTAALAGRGFPCPRPIPATSGDLAVRQPGLPMASMITWIDAAPIGEHGQAFAGPVTRYKELGGLIARMHAITDNLDLGSLDRPSWDAEAILGEDPHWGRFWENPSLSAEEVQFLLRARENAAQHLASLAAPDIGLIHADLLQENILENPEGISIIDFDDSGLGYRLYDLGTALIQHAEDPKLPDLSEALCAGYAAQKGLAENPVALMPLFIMLRSMASCGWIMLRAEADDPRQRVYAERALRCARTYLES
ncbi:MAG: phosphotransferase [Paracoccaceae bacterium]